MQATGGLYTTLHFVERLIKMPSFRYDTIEYWLMVEAVSEGGCKYDRNVV